MEQNKGKIKSFVNKKVLVAVGGAISLFVSIVVMTLVQAGFNWSDIVNNVDGARDLFLSNLTINTAISIASMICGYYLFQNWTYNNPKGEYQVSAIAYRTEKLLYDKTSNKFADWHNDVYYPQEKQAEFEDIMRKSGIQQKEVLDLDMTQVKSLLGKPQKYGDKFYMSLTQEQLDTIIRIKSGKIVINKLPDDYFYNIRGMFSKKRAYIRAGREGAIKSSRFAYQIVSKVIMGVMTTSIFAGLVASKDGVDEQAWINLLIRLYTLFANGLYGGVIATNMLLVELYFIHYKTHVLQLFNRDVENGYTTKTIEEKAKEEFTNRVKEENLMIGGGE